MVLSTDEKEVSYPFPIVDEFTLGSGANNHIKIPHPNISKQHFAIRTNWEGLSFIYDMGSKRGTYIGNKKLEKGQLLQLHFGDTITLGKHDYAFQIG